MARLTIWWPADYDVSVGHMPYSEGIIARDHQYNKIAAEQKLSTPTSGTVYKNWDLPYGGITFNELLRNCYYRSVLMANLRGCVDQYAECINRLTGFYNNSSQQGKNEVPGFWDQQRHL